MNCQTRELVPVRDVAWTQIDEEATPLTEHLIAARRLVALKGPPGWAFSAVDAGPIDRMDHGAPAGVEVALQDFSIGYRSSEAASVDLFVGAAVHDAYR